MKRLPIIDSHCHLRGQEYDCDYRRMALADAAACGIAALYEMPNTTPPLTSLPAIYDRNSSLVLPADAPIVRQHIGITNDPVQAKNAIEAVMSTATRSPSDKIYYSHSTGNMGVLDHDYQRWLWKMKVDLGYTGVSMGHFEDEELFTGEYDPADPVSHSLHRNATAETVCVERQLRNAFDAGFRGTFYVCHVSNPATVKLARRFEVRHPSLRVCLEVTWHHLFLDTRDYKAHGNRVKINPPLRYQGLQEELLHHCLDDDIDVIGSDHAPHPLERKDDPVNPASGIPALPFWPKGLEMLRNLGASTQLLNEMTYHAPSELFKIGIKEVEVESNYDPARWDAYEYNPFSRVDH